MFYDGTILHTLDDHLEERYSRCLERINSAERIVMKFGTDAVNSIFNGYGDSLAADIHSEMSAGKDLIVISSGAIGQGRRLKSIEEPDSVIERSVYASLGQPHLMYRWFSILSPYGIHASQLLYENENLTGRSTHRDYIKNGLESMLRNDILPIVNENDAVTSEEISTSGKAKTFGDNDNLAMLVCELTDADLMIFFTGSGGVYDDINDSSSLYDAIFSQDDGFYGRFADSISPEGEGGMRSKLMTSAKLADKGTPVIISSPERSNPLRSYRDGSLRQTVIVPPYHLLL